METEEQSIFEGLPQPGERSPYYTRLVKAQKITGFGFAALLLIEPVFALIFSKGWGSGEVLLLVIVVLIAGATIVRTPPAWVITALFYNSILECLLLMLVVVYYEHESTVLIFPLIIIIAALSVWLIHTKSLSASYHCPPEKMLLYRLMALAGSVVVVAVFCVFCVSM